MNVDNFCKYCSMSAELLLYRVLNSKIYERVAGRPARTILSLSISHMGNMFRGYASSHFNAKTILTLSAVILVASLPRFTTMDAT